MKANLTDGLMRFLENSPLDGRSERKNDPGGS